MKKMLFIALLLLCMGSQAQVRLSVSPYIHGSYYIGHDTVNAGDTDSIGVWVVNSGASAYTGQLRVDVGVHDSANFSQIDSVTTGLTSAPLTLPPGDSVELTYMTTYYTMGTGAVYHYGIDVIVVWPVALSSVTPPVAADSAEFNFFITGTSVGIPEPLMPELIHTYPNPAHEQLQIDGAIRVKTVTLYNSTGQAVLREDNNSSIDIHALPQGIYFMDIYSADKKHYYSRILKE